MKTRIGWCVSRWLIVAGLLLAAVGLWAARAAETPATRVGDFLNSIGACSAVSKRGENLVSTIEAVKHLGLRWIRAGYESGIPVADLLEVHRQTGILGVSPVQTLPKASSISLTLSNHPVVIEVLGPGH